MAKDDDVKIEKEHVPGGIEVEHAEGEIEPPLGAREGEEPPEEVPEAKKVTGKIPLSPAVIKPPLRLEGTILAEATGWAGWLYTEEELEELTNLIAECGIELSPQIQVVIALGTMHGVRVAGYLHWKKKGRPGDTRKRTGEEAKKEVPGEETKI